MKAKSPVAHPIVDTHLTGVLDEALANVFEAGPSAKSSSLPFLVKLRASGEATDKFAYVEIEAPDLRQ